MSSPQSDDFTSHTGSCRRSYVESGVTKRLFSGELFRLNSPLIKTKKLQTQSIQIVTLPLIYQATVLIMPSSKLTMHCLLFVLAAVSTFPTVHSKDHLLRRTLFNQKDLTHLVKDQVRKYRLRGLQNQQTEPPLTSSSDSEDSISEDSVSEDSISEDQ